MPITRSSATQSAASASQATSERHLVRWYVLTFPYAKKGITLGIERELARRKVEGGMLFEYFAPSFTETVERDGQLVDTHQSLLFNYLFVHTTEDDIFLLKRHQPQYSVLRRVAHADGSSHIPYVDDHTIQTLRWVARSYGGYIPLCMLDHTLLLRGDRIRITQGQFRGVEAQLVRRPRSTTDVAMVFVDNWMCVPLLNVAPQQYQVIDVKAVPAAPSAASGLDEASLSEQLHQALLRHHRGESTPQDSQMAQAAYTQLSALQPATTVLRCKLYALLLPAVTIIDDPQKRADLLRLIELLLPHITAPQSLALMMVTLYGCTDNIFYHHRAAALLAPWQSEPAPKPSKRLLLTRFVDYEKALLCKEQ